MLSWGCRLVAYSAYSSWRHKVGLGPPGCSLPNRLFCSDKSPTWLQRYLGSGRSQWHFVGGFTLVTTFSRLVQRGSTGQELFCLCSATLWFPVDVIVNQFCYILDINKLDKWVGSLDKRNNGKYIAFRRNTRDQPRSQNNV